MDLFPQKLNKEREGEMNSFGVFFFGLVWFSLLFGEVEDVGEKILPLGLKMIISYLCCLFCHDVQANATHASVHKFLIR